MYICSLSNTPTSNPVLSLKSHCIFDSKALETFIKTNGKDPISNELMELTDIIPISSIKNNDLESIPNSNEIMSTNYSSIPTMLSSFQSAWDSLSLELFQLRSELDKTRKELSLSLYKQDAAIKVAVDACKERDEARKALSKLIDNGVIDNEINTDHKIDQVNDVNNNHKEEEEEEDLSNQDDFFNIIRSEQESLLSIHKKENKERKGKSPLYQLSDISNLNLIFDHKECLVARKSGKIIEIQPNSTNTECIVTYETGLFHLVDISNESKKMKVISKINIKQEPDNHDKLLSVWIKDEPFILCKTPQKSSKNKTNPSLFYQLKNLRTKESQNIATELTNITLVASHPSLSLILISDSKEFEVIYNHSTIYSQEINGEINNIKFHPDGLLIALSYVNGTGIDIYDLAERNFKLNIPFENPQKIKFASNGYYLLIGGNEGILKLFDLRKNIFIQESIFDKDSQNDSKLLLDNFTSIVIYNEKYSTFDVKGKLWNSEIHHFQGLDNETYIESVLSNNDNIILLVTKNNDHDGCDLYKIALQ